MDSYYMIYGVKRRLAILDEIKTRWHDRLPVNNKWQWSMKDPDLFYLMKKGKLKQVRDSQGIGGKSQTYLELVK